MRRLHFVAIAAFLLGAVVGSTALASATSTESTAPTVADDLRRKQQPDLVRLSENVSCRSLNCINRSLTRLNRHVNDLEFDVFVCEALLPVSYDGSDYIYYDDLFTEEILIAYTC